MAESYVDFGIPFMFVTLLLFGMLLGMGYGWLVRLAPARILGCAIGTIMLLRCGVDVASSNAKMLGTLVDFSTYKADAPENKR